jgi:diacylglycerol kinase family enzyme
MYVLVTMISNLEEHFCISPASKPLDGQLRLVRIAPVGAGKLMQVLESAYQDGKHVEDKLVQYEAVEGLRIDVEEKDEKWRQVCIDGKIVAVEQGGWVEVRKESRTGVRLVMPPLQALQPGDA